MLESQATNLPLIEFPVNTPNVFAIIFLRETHSDCLLEYILRYFCLNKGRDFGAQQKHFDCG